MVQPPPPRPKCSMEPSRELDADVTSLGAGDAVRCQNPREQVLTRRPQSRGSRCPCSRCGQRDEGASVPPAPQGPVGTASTWPSSALRRGWRIGSWCCLVTPGPMGWVFAWGAERSRGFGLRCHCSGQAGRPQVLGGSLPSAMRVPVLAH